MHLNFSNFMIQSKHNSALSSNKGIMSTKESSPLGVTDNLQCVCSIFVSVADSQVKCESGLFIAIMLCLKWSCCYIWWSFLPPLSDSEAEELSEATKYGLFRGPQLPWRIVIISGTVHWFWLKTSFHPLLWILSGLTGSWQSPRTKTLWLTKMVPSIGTNVVT